MLSCCSSSTGTAHWGDTGLSENHKIFTYNHSGVVVSTVASQRKGSRFNSRLGPFCVEFAFMRGFSGGTLTSSMSKYLHVRLIGVSDIVLRSEWLFISGPVMDWQTVQSVPRVSPDCSRGASSLLCYVVSVVELYESYWTSHPIQLLQQHYTYANSRGICLQREWLCEVRTMQNRVICNGWLEILEGPVTVLTLRDSLVQRLL